MSKSTKDYENLLALSHHAKVLEGISHILNWDQETYMPPDSSGIRAAQIATMAGLIHKEKTSKKYEQALKKLVNPQTGTILAKGLDPAKLSCLREWSRDYQKSVALPTKFVKDFAKLTSQATEAWKVAKKDNAFQRFAPYLDRIITKCREKADLVGYKEHPYDALLDDFEPGITTKEVTKLFSELGKSITTLLKKITATKQIDDSFLFGKFDSDKQIEFCKVLLKSMGYEMSKGRLDLSSHPFSMASHPTDSRVTIRIHPTSLMSSISAALHEGGHSLYEMGLCEEHYGSPLCEAVSLGVHESQSRWWETRIGQSKPFWKHFLPLLKKTFPGKLDNISLADFYRAINKVEPSFIRVEADEVTYSLHVILRFELEKALIEGNLKVREIPEAWNAKMQEYFGITPKNDREGCLQDIHWSLGAFGYFPTYTLGNLYAAQMFDAFEKEHPGWKELVSQGKLGFIRQWLQEAVHQNGRMYQSKELLKKISGKKFSEDYYTQYLTGKYSEIYHIRGA